MEKPSTNNAVDTHSENANGRSHLVFVAIGVAIVLGGLWLLYANDGPYHLDFPISENEEQPYNGS